jgi:hypothetical protein
MKPGRVASAFGVKDPVSQTETTFDVTIIDIQCTGDYPRSNMKTQSASKDTLIPTDLLEQVQAMATAEQRSPIEILRDAIELYRRDHGNLVEPVKDASAAVLRSRREAVARILERRQYRHMPGGMTIRDMMTLGRA